MIVGDACIDFTSERRDEADLDDNVYLSDLDLESRHNFEKLMLDRMAMAQGLPPPFMIADCPPQYMTHDGTLVQSAEQARPSFYTAGEGSSSGSSHPAASASTTMAAQDSAFIDGLHPEAKQLALQLLELRCVRVCSRACVCAVCLVLQLHDLFAWHILTPTTKPPTCYQVRHEGAVRTVCDGACFPGHHQHRRPSLQF